MHNLGVSDRASGRLNAPKTTDSIWSRQNNHKRRQNLDSRHLTLQPPGRPAVSDYGQQGVTGHHRGEQAMVPQPYANPHAHRKTQLVPRQKRWRLDIRPLPKPARLAEIKWLS